MKKKQQHIPHKLTEAQKQVEQNIEGWRQTPKPSKLLVVIALACFIAFATIAIFWAGSYKLETPGGIQHRYDDLVEAYWDRIHTTNEMIQLLMQELDWYVRLEDDQWWFDCRERLGLE